MSTNPVSPTPTPRREQLGLLALVAAAIVIGLIVIVYVVSQDSAPIVLSQASTPIPVNETANANPLTRSTFATYGIPQLGKPDAPITIVLFSNFSCPHCMDYEPTMKQITDRFVATGKAKLVFVPLIFASEPSVYAAISSLCADEQGKFWEMKDALFVLHEKRGGNAFDATSVKGLAGQIGLDVVRFGTCADANFNEFVKVFEGTAQACPADNHACATLFQSLQLANAAQIEGTPTLVYSKDDGKTWERFHADDGSDWETGVTADYVGRIIDAQP